MAKDNKKAISLMDVNEENFSEALKSVNTFGEDIVKAAAEKEEEHEYCQKDDTDIDEEKYLTLFHIRKLTIVRMWLQHRR